MITISGKQNDNEVETSIVHLMQMYTFNIEVLQKSKYFYLAGQPSRTRPGAAPGIYNSFFFKYTTALWSGKENSPVSGNAGQSNTDSHYDSQMIHIDKMCLQQNATQMLRGNTVPSPWGELTKYKCLHKICLHKIGF